MSIPLGSYEVWQLAQASTPSSALDELVRRAIGAEIDQADRIMEGYSNEVYRVRCVDDQDVVVRILRFDDGDLATRSAGEARAIERARAAEVPAPETLLLDTVVIDGSEFPVMVQRAVPGRPLGEVIHRLSGRQRRDVLTEVGGLIARINGIRADEERDWPTAMAADLADRRAERDKIIGAGFSASQFDRMLELLASYASDFPCEQWVLCHGDLSPKHIFVAGDGSDAAVRVSGIIDFGDWTPGAPVHDLAVLRARAPHLDLLPLLTGYGRRDDEMFRRRLDLHTLGLAVSSLAFSVVEDNKASIERTGQQIRTLVSDLEGRSSKRKE